MSDRFYGGRHWRFKRRLPALRRFQHARAIMSVGNLMRIVAIAVIAFVALIAELFIQAGADVADTTNRIHLRRRRRKCRGTFMPERPVPAQPTCGQCGYNLTDNVSGICPECGEPVKARGHKADVRS